MPVEIELNELPAGYSESSARGGGMIKVSQKGFYSSEDGEELTKRLEGWPDYFLKLVPSKTPLKPSYIDTLLVVISKDKKATIYFNDAQVIGEMRVKGACEKGEAITANRILDIGKMQFSNAIIPEDAGFIYVFSVGWRQGFIYDLEPLHQEEKRDFDIEETLGSCFTYLLFQERFKIDDQTWDTILLQKWFPFSYLDDKLIKKLVSYAKEGWEIDDLSPEIHKDVNSLLKKAPFTRKSSPCFEEHKEIIEKAIERYLEADYISCTSILYPRIEGLMRSFHKTEGYKSKPSSKNLTKTVISHHQKRRIYQSLLLPDKFQNYLENIYFASFSPGTMPDVGRHSVAHGEARKEEFDLKSSTIAILVLYQLSLFMTV